MASLKEQLKNLDLKQVKLTTNETLSNIMANEAKRLYGLIQQEIDNYYKSYHPIIYNRTEGYRKSLYAEDIANIKVVGNSLEIGVGFNESLATHENLFEGHYSFVPLLMERGWIAKRLEDKYGVIERFTRFDGIKAVERAIEEFNRTNKYGIIINADKFYNARVY